MGGCSSKSKSNRGLASPGEPNRAPSAVDMLNVSNGTRSHRQRLAWHRENTPVTDVYEVLEIVGQGSMGEVTICQKKVGAAVKAEKRKEDLLANLSEHDDDETLQIAAKITRNLSFSSIESLTKKDGSVKGNGAAKRRRYACKTVNTMWMKTTDIKEYLNEIDILRDLDHPNIIQLFEVYSMKRKVWIITELCSGGDLTARSNLTEAEVAIVVEQILLAVKYMHKRNVCHRDIKMENIMYAASDTDDARIKLIDFGLSNKFTKGEKMIKACGTVYTAAPEMLIGEGSIEGTDIWAIGVVTFILLSGSYPFLRGSNDFDDKEKISMLANAQYILGPEWNEREISNPAREFIARCFKRRPSDRWCAAEALEFIHESWIPHLHDSVQNQVPASDPKRSLTVPRDSSAGGEGKVNGAPLPKSKKDTLSRSVHSKRKRTRMDSGMVQSMRKYGEYSELKKTILMTMAYTMDKSSLHELGDMFAVLDSSNTGTVTLADLKQSLRQVRSDKHMEDETIEKLFHGIDVDSSGEIHYNEFLAAVVESQGLITMEHLADAFDRLDSSGKGYISREDLQNILGGSYRDDVVDMMLDEADYKKNGQIDYSEFLRLMFEDPTKGIHALGTSKHATDNTMTIKLGSIDPASRISISHLNGDDYDVEDKLSL